MGLIYCVTFPSGKQYVGQTRQSLRVRINQHKAANDDTLICRAFRKYASFEVRTVLETDNSLLDKEEQRFIDMYNTLSPNGYNFRTGGQKGYFFTKDVRNKCSQLARKNGLDLPMYIYLYNEGYRCRPPGRPERYFCYRHLSKETNLLLAKEYLGGKDELYKEHVEVLPKFIAKVDRPGRTGYRCTLPGFEKHFTSMKVTNEEKFNMALDYLNSIKKKDQRLNVSGGSIESS